MCNICSLYYPPGLANSIGIELSVVVFFLQGKGIGDVSISVGDKLHSTTTSEGVYVLNNVTAGEYIIQVKCRQQH